MKKVFAIILAIAVAFTYVPFTGITANDASAAAKKKQGIVKIKGKYYLYNTAGKKIKKTKTVKGVKYYISTDKSHYIRARLYKKKLYYSNGRRMTKADKKDFETQLRADRIVKRITKKKWSKYRKLKKCFRYVMNFHYKTRRKFRRTKDWPAVYANDHFRKGSGNCHSDAAAFAYLAASCGYKRVYIASDTRRSVSSSHSWTEVNGRAFDPLFAQAKSYSRNWNSRYGVYELRPAIKVKIPYGKASHNKKGKMIPKKTQPYKEKPKPKVLKIEKWSAKDKKLYYNDGSVVKGTVVWKGKFYAFTDKGKYREDFTKKLRSAATEGKDISELTALIGNPKKKTYADSCYSPGPGKDGIWKYSKFTVYTYKPESGQEIFISAE